MDEQKRPVVTVEMASGGRFAFELHPEWAPNACNSVIALAQAGAYDGMDIQRIVPGELLGRIGGMGVGHVDFVEPFDNLEAHLPGGG